MAIEWKSKYETGDDRIDQQHKTLFETINGLEVMLQGGDISETIVRDTLRFLINYTRIHFAYEEFCMINHKCPVAGKNIIAHDKFTEALDMFGQRFKSEGASRALLVEIHDSTVNWLVNHICKIDVRLQSSLT